MGFPRPSIEYGNLVWDTQHQSHWGRNHGRLISFFGVVGKVSLSYERLEISMGLRVSTGELNEASSTARELHRFRGRYRTLANNMRIVEIPTDDSALFAPRKLFKQENCVEVLVPVYSVSCIGYDRNFASPFQQFNDRPVTFNV